MISALKMIADVIAESGLCRCRMLSLARPGITAENMAGMMAKYFATSLVMEKVVSAPRVISNCLPISTISMSLVGLESRSTMFPASLAAEVPVFIATPTSAWASAGGPLGPSPLRAGSAAGVPDPVLDRAGRALADLPAVGQVHPAHPGLRGELDELRALQFT